jgi:hypothetical protein
VQRERELAADAVEIREQRSCLVHWKRPASLFGRPPAAPGIVGEASESVTRLEPQPVTAVIASTVFA